MKKVKRSVHYIGGRPTEGHIHRKFKYSHEWVKGSLQDIIKEIEDFNVDEHN